MFRHTGGSERWTTDESEVEMDEEEKARAQKAWKLHMQAQWGEISALK